MKKITITLLIACAFTACSVKLLPLTQSDVERGNKKYPGVTMETLNEGKNTFTQNCNMCHGLKNPKSRTEAEWNKIVPIMVSKVNKKKGHEEIDANEQTHLLQYLVTMGK